MTPWPRDGLSSAGSSIRSNRMRGSARFRCFIRLRVKLNGVAQRLTLLGALLGTGCGSGQPALPEIGDGPPRDALGRTLDISSPVERVICSGAGCLRLLTYLQAQDRIVAVDSIERSGSPLNARPYAIANPQFKKYPLFGEFRGWDNPELIASLDPAPQLIFKIVGGRGQHPAQLQKKTGIPVIPLQYGNLSESREILNRNLRVMADIVGKRQRAEEVIGFFDTLERDLRRRTRDIPDALRPACYVGGVGQSGPHGLQSTDPSFEPFAFVSARNVAAPTGRRAHPAHAVVAKEQLIVWDPAVVFVDISTLRLGAGADAMAQLRNDPAFRNLTAVKEGRVYGLFPHNSYNRNIEIVYANAYFVGSVLYPDRFADITPMAKAEEIATFLNGGPAFEILNQELGGMGFRRIPLEK
jgi:iron complex transport system substrate-binding protein